MDLYLSQASPAYLDRLVTYHRVLTQKNACLRAEQDPAPFNELLIEHGAALMQFRHAFLQELQPLAARFYADIAGGAKFSLAYQPSVCFDARSVTMELLQQAFQRTLRQNEERERAVKSALVGPHRDDIYLQIDDYPARSHGSQGEWRTAVIALKLAVYHLLATKRGTQPVLLLDEVFAELDAQRTQGLVHAIGDFGQLFLTTAADPPASWRQDSRSFKIFKGAVQEIS